MTGTTTVPTRSSAAQIADQVVDAILSGRIAPGQRLGEQELAGVFGVSRTLVREAMARLSARGMVEVSSRRGWFVVQPSRAEAADAFTARVAIETGMLGALAPPLAKDKLARLRLAFAVAALSLFVALMGCGGTGTTVPPTPQGTFQVTVTATSAVTGDSGNATIAVTVPQ